MQDQTSDESHSTERDDSIAMNDQNNSSLPVQESSMPVQGSGLTDLNNGLLGQNSGLLGQNSGLPDQDSDQQAAEWITPASSDLGIKLLNRACIFLLLLALHPGLWLSEREYYFKLKGLGGSWLIFTTMMLLRPQTYKTLGLFGCSVILAFHSSMSTSFAEYCNSLFSFIDLDQNSYSLWTLLLGLGLSEIFIYFRSEQWNLVDRFIASLINTYFLCSIFLYLWFLRIEMSNFNFNLHENTLLKFGSLALAAIFIHKVRSFFKVRETSILGALSMILVGAQVFAPLIFTGDHKQLLIYPLLMDKEALTYLKELLASFGLM